MLRPRPLAALFLLAACDGGSGSGGAGGGGSGGGGGACAFTETEAPPPAPVTRTPRWAFEPWISKDISDGADTRAFVEGFQSRDIPVGVVVLDSPWETHYNTFVPNPTRYPEFATMVSDLRATGVRTVLWVTQMVNTDSFDLESGGDAYVGPSPNYQEGYDCGFYVNGSDLYGWWKGSGSGVDFFHPGARAWWHRQQDALLQLGVAGWKLDFGESYIQPWTDPVTTYEGDVTHQAYSEAYYHDFYAYGASVLGTEEFVTMVRPWDQSYQFEGRFYARREDAPVAWVGDNRRDWVGLSDALDHVFRSAAYPVVGSDIGGYLSRDDLTFETIPFDVDVFHRWTAVAALWPFMQLHGQQNITPWNLPDGSDPTETIDSYRFWATLHHELVPFFYSLAEEAWASGGGTLYPEGAEASWPGDYRFRVGEGFLVAPLLDASAQRDVALPAGDDWVDFWDDAAPLLAGGQTVSRAAPDARYSPLFLRAGAIVPLACAGGLTGLCTPGSSGLAGVLVVPGPASSFVLHEDDGTTDLASALAGGAATISLSRATATTLLRVRFEGAVGSVTVGGAPATPRADVAALDAAPDGWVADAARQLVWIKLAPSASPVDVVVD